MAGSLNRGYYKMHLENVHGIQHNSEKLLTWTLAQQNLSGWTKYSLMGLMTLFKVTLHL